MAEWSTWLERHLDAVDIPKGRGFESHPPSLISAFLTWLVLVRCLFVLAVAVRLAGFDP
jgi:hypothetical protein